MRNNYKFSTLLLLILVPLGVFINSAISNMLESHVFRIKNIELRGVNLSMDSTFQTSLSSLTNTPLASVNINLLKEHLKKSVFIEDLTIQKQFPYTLAINVIERVPLALIKVANTAYTVNKDGIILPIVASNLIPVSIDFGIAINGSQIVDEYILEMLKSLDSKKTDIASINIDKNRRASFKLHDHKIDFMIDKHILSTEFINKAQKITQSLITNTNKTPKSVDLYSDPHSAIGYF